MSDETPERPSPSVPRKIYLKRTAASGRPLARLIGGALPPEQPSPANDLVLRQLQSLRQEFKAILERSVSDRQVIIRIGERMEQGFENVRSDIRQLRDEVKSLRSDVVLLENRLLTTQNEILDVVRRIDEAENEPFEIIEAEDEPGPVAHG